MPLYFSEGKQDDTSRIADYRWQDTWGLEPIVGRSSGGLFHRQTHLNHKVGLYRVKWNADIMAIGVGTQRKGGMAAKLSAFSQSGDGSRKYHAGRKIREHREILDVEVLITGEDETARQIARDLKAPIMRLRKPDWSVFNALYTPRA